ncbi:MAG: hypothetical protein AAGF30_05475 [Pseudomonadota bacterium]
MIRTPNTLRHFLRNETAAVSVEAAIMMPVLMIFCLVIYTYFDSYRKGLGLTKASYALSDVISRQDLITPEFIDGLHDIFDFIAAADGDSFIRVTQLRHQGGEVQVIWSYATGANDVEALTQATLQAYLDHIPTMRPAEHMVALEASAVYAPAFNIGLPVRRSYSMIASRQRGGTKAIWDTNGDGLDDTPANWP